MTTRTADPSRQHGVSHEPEAAVEIPQGPPVTVEEALTAVPSRRKDDVERARALLGEAGVLYREVPL